MKNRFEEGEIVEKALKAEGIETPPVNPSKDAIASEFKDNTALVPSEAIKAPYQSPFNLDRMKAEGITDQNVIEVVEMISKGKTFIECCWYLMRLKEGITFQMASEVLNTALKETVGKVSHEEWTSSYRLMAQDLYQRLKDKKPSQAISVLNSMIKLQYLSQASEFRRKELDHEKAKFEAAITLPAHGGQRALMESIVKGEAYGLNPTARAGFRLQIESYSPPQSTPSENQTVPYDRKVHNTIPSPDSRDRETEES